MCVIDERELEMKKDEAKNTCKRNHFGKLGSPLTPILVHGIQLLQCRLSTLLPIYLVKQLEMWLDFLHVRVYVKHGIVPLVIHDIMCIRNPNTFTLPLENRQLAQQNFFYYVVLRRMNIHNVDT
jgi:hypothetical protein